MPVERRPVEILHAVLPCPLAAQERRRLHAVLPVDRRPAAESRAGQHRHVAVGGLGRPTAVEEVLVRPQLELVEVGLVVVAARLQHDDALARLRQGAGDCPTAGAGADDDDIGVERDLVALRDEGLDRLLDGGRRADRAGVAELRPEGVAPPLVREGVGQHGREPAQGTNPLGRLRSRRLDALDDRLPHLLGLADEPGGPERVEELPHPGAKFRRQLGGEVRLQGDVRADIGALAGPEAGGVVVPRQAGHEGVAQGREGGALGVAEPAAHLLILLWLGSPPARQPVRRDGPSPRSRR